MYGLDEGVKDGEVLDGWWDAEPLGRHARVTSTSLSTGPNILLASYKQLPVGVTFWYPVPCMRMFRTLSLRKDRPIYRLKSKRHGCVERRYRDAR